MEELNKKLAEWAGFKQRGMSYTGFHIWVNPNEIRHFDRSMREQQGEEYPRMPDKDKHYQCPNFTESLDACFKWLVPRLFSCELETLSTRGEEGYEALPPGT